MPHDPDLPLVEPDPGVRDPVVVRWKEVRARDDRSLLVVFGRGVWQRLHSVSVVESEEEVVVTLRLGTLPELPRREAFVLVAVIEAVRVELAGPLAGRAVRDGGARG